jgi:hypothetical protein
VTTKLEQLEHRLQHYRDLYDRAEKEEARIEQQIRDNPKNDWLVFKHHKQHELLWTLSAIVEEVKIDIMKEQIKRAKRKDKKRAKG